MHQPHYVVTGVASGIGAALAAQLLERRCRVTGFDVRPPAGAAFPCHALNLGDLGAIDPAVVKALGPVAGPVVGQELGRPSGQTNEQTNSQTLGPFDGLCNNAGVSPKPGHEVAILTINFFAQRVFTRALLPHLAPGASIVNMASRAGARWRENIEQVKRLAALDPRDVAAFVVDERIDAARAYNLSKEALIAWTLAESEAMTARGQRINAVCPGAVATGLLPDFAAAFGEAMARNVARAGRPGQPEEIASIAAFLLSPQSSWLRGAEISPDGGMGAFAASDALGLTALRL
jgi:NAD(P)-dependent dehydrogenase (short-subunit alcohol dehydrogenase family)